ncbi:MAG: M56 family metallopeptidase [bacterium]|nr:M56 family metallopeptidase [bacterium]
MSWVVSLLTAHGLVAAAAVSVVLGVGAAALRGSRSPQERYRTAELAIGASLLLCLLLWIPLPRPGAGWLAGPVAGTESVGFEAGSPAVAVPAAHFGAAPPRVLEPRLAAADDDAGRTVARIFLVGALVLGAHFVFALLMLSRTLSRARGAPERITRHARGAARVLVSKEVGRPFCCALPRATIVVPEQLEAPEHETRLLAVLAHELAHLAQRHPRGRILVACAAPLLYWHPLFWWLVREARRSAELIADDMAIDSVDKRRYIEELCEVASATRGRLVGGALGPGAFGSRHEFLERMETLLMRQTRLATRSSSLHVAARGLCAVLLLGSISVAWGRAPQSGGGGQASSDGLIASLVTSGGGLPAAVELSVGFQFDDERALGAFLVGAADDGMRIGAVDLPRVGAGSGRVALVTLRGANEQTLQVLAQQVAGVELLSITKRPAHRGGLPAGTSAPGRGLDSGGGRGSLGVGVGRGLAGGGPASGSGPANGSGPAGGTGAGPALPDNGSSDFGLDSQLTTDLLDPAQSNVNNAVPTIPDVAGAILLVQPVNGSTYVSINRGTNDAVRVGLNFEVYRGSEYKGRVKVTRTSHDHCLGVVELEVAGRGIERGDNATTKL